MTASTDSPRVLVDTNVVVHAYDLDEPRKHGRARELLKSLSDAQRLVFSAQVFNEFCSVMMKPKRKEPLRPDEIAVLLRELEATGDVVPITASMTLRAPDAMPRHGFSSWDALIRAAAADNGIEVIPSCLWLHRPGCGAGNQRPFAPQQNLYFSPLPQGHGA
jgi:predicted nucleic acid-binding protein